MALTVSKQKELFTKRTNTAGGVKVLGIVGGGITTSKDFSSSGKTPFISMSEVTDAKVYLNVLLH